MTGKFYFEGITKKDLGGNYGLGFVCLALKNTLKAGIMRCWLDSGEILI
jgi:hypothetical protein